MITVHHLENSRSQRVLWLLEELTLDYELKKYTRDPQTQLAPKSLLKINPLGKSPAITVEDRVIFESGAIFHYLLSHNDHNHILHPELNSDLYQDYIFWMHFCEGSLMPPLVMNFVHQRVEKEVPFLVRPVASKIFSEIRKAYLSGTIKQSLTFVESHLKANEFFLGSQFSAADIMMSFPLETFVCAAGAQKQYPAIEKFVEMMKSRSAYQAALTRGGDYIY